MSSGRSPGWEERCPPLALLEDFNLGRLAFETFEAVADHASSCDRCEAVLERLEGKDDSFVLSLGRYLAPATAAKDADSSSPLTTGGDVSEGSRFGQYELLELLGEGGMGTVYKALQDRPRRHVAVKVAHGKRSLRVEALARLRTEVEAVGRLQHPNIIQIYESGEQHGRPYFAMEYARGGSLAGRLKREPLTEREAGELVRTLARAVGAVHRLGLIHRDLKPANVLLGEDGTPKLADFGLAKFLDELDAPMHQTVVGAVLGTAPYMAPEQARGELGGLGPAVDVYGLGAILFESLTGTPPFRGETREAILRQVESVPAPSPSTSRGVSPVIAAICSKCLEKAPGRRYASALELADDLERWLKGAPTRARPPGWWARYRRSLAIGMAVAALAVLLAAGLRRTVRTNSELQWRSIERKLGRMQPVTLITDDGAPTYYRIRRGDDATKINVDSDGTVTVHSWSHSLIELVRNPGTKQYRFQVEVRHERSDPAGAVGVYFAHKAFPESTPPRNYFGKITYNDILDVAGAAVARAPERLRPGLVVPGSNFVSMGMESWGQKPVGPPWMASSRMKSGAPFQPCGVLGDRWRTLDVMVTPQGFEGTWDGRPIGILPADQLDSMVRSQLQIHLGKKMGLKHPDLGETRFDPMGSVGLFVARGSASFRGARITPISGGPGSGSFDDEE